MRRSSFRIVFEEPELPFVYILRCRDGSFYTGAARTSRGGCASTRRDALPATRARGGPSASSGPDGFAPGARPSGRSSASSGSHAATRRSWSAAGKTRLPELLVSCQELSKAFGATPLFEGLSLGVSEGDHVGLVGPNGSGKSTLLKILAGLEEPTSGTRAVRKRLRIGYVPQDPVFDAGATVGGVLRAALHDLHLEDGEIQGRIAVTMGKAGLEDGDKDVATLSGGWRKRLAIAQELVREPELLLLDEPTNHLDVEGILWLEELLPREPEPSWR